MGVDRGDKAALRQAILANRRTRREKFGVFETRAIAQAARQLIRERQARIVAAYEPLPTEPDISGLMVGAVNMDEVGEASAVASTKETSANTASTLPLQILLPRVEYVDQELAPPKWVSPQGILPADAVSSADIVFVPALGVDVSGTRLGRGGGWYDRTLPFSRGLIVAVAFADEVFAADYLPREPHDVPVDAVITENGFKKFSTGKIA